MTGSLQISCSEECEGRCRNTYGKAREEPWEPSTWAPEQRLIKAEFFIILHHHC